MRRGGTHLSSQHSGGGAGGSDIQGHSWLHRELESSLVYIRLGGACVKMETARGLQWREGKEGVGRGGIAEGFFLMEDGCRLQDSVCDQPGKIQSEGEGSISDRVWRRPSRVWVAPGCSPPLKACAGPQNTKLNREGQGWVSQLFDYEGKLNLLYLNKQLLNIHQKKAISYSVMQDIGLPDTSLKVPRKDKTITLYICLWLDKNTFWNKVCLICHIKRKRYRASNGTDKSHTDGEAAVPVPSTSFSSVIAFIYPALLESE